MAEDILAQACRLAQNLNGQDVDVNEVEKVLAYARKVRDTAKVKEMVGRLARLKNIMVYSNKTKGYEIGRAHV